MAKFSTGLHNRMLNDAGFKTLMDGGVLKIFDVESPADIPVTADAAEAGTLLMTLTAGGDGTTGLTFGLPDGRVISKTEAELWMTSAIAATGKCGYFRFLKMTDDGSASDTALRIQGTCGIVNADMVLTNPNVTAGQPWTLNYFNVALPTL